MSVLSLILASWFFAAAPVEAAPAYASIPEEWRQTWRVFGVDPAIAESVVWPEMQHYSYMRDMLETGANSITCASKGGGMDFSIGIFQMKPSFVEKLETAWHVSGLADYYNLSFNTSDSVEARRSRIDRMAVDAWQVIYLGMFLRLLDYSYGLHSLPLEEQVRLSANAYNHGCAWPAEGCGDVESLRVNMDARQFPRVIIHSRNVQQYSYSVLAWEHYQSIAD